MGPKYVRFMFRKKQLERLEYKTGCSNSSSYKKRLRGDKVPHLFRYSCSKSIHFPKSSLSDVDNPNELLSPLSLEREEQGVMVMSHKRQKLNPGRSMIAISSEQTQIRDQANEEKSVELGQKGEVYAESLMEDGELSGERDDNGFTMDLSESVSDSAKDNVQSGERDDNGFTMDLSESVSDGAKDNVQSGERDVNVVSMELSESSVDGAKVDAQKTKPASAPMPESKNVRKPPKAIRIVDAETVQILHKLQGVLSTKSGKLMQYKDVVRTLAVQWAGSKKKLNSLLEDWDRFVVRHPEYFDDRLKDLEPIGKTSSLSMSTSQPTSRDRVRTVFRQTFSPTSPPNSQPNSQPTFRQGHKPTSQPAVRPVSRRAETQLGSIQAKSRKKIADRLNSRPVTRSNSHSVPQLVSRPTSPVNQLVSQQVNQSVSRPGVMLVSLPETRQAPRSEPSQVSRPPDMSVSCPESRHVSLSGVRPVARPAVGSVSRPEVSQVSLPEARQMSRSAAKQVSRAPGMAVPHPEARQISLSDVRLVSCPVETAVSRPEDVVPMSRPATQSEPRYPETRSPRLISQRKRNSTNRRRVPRQENADHQRSERPPSVNLQRKKDPTTKRKRKRGRENVKKATKKVRKLTCDQCDCIRNILPENFNERCYCEISFFPDLLEISEVDFYNAEGSNNRLGQIEPVPKSLGDCNAVQKRIVCYYKIFCEIWKVVRERRRREIPLCIVAKVRLRYPDPPDSQELCETEETLMFG
eukprot:11979_1